MTVMIRNAASGLFAMALIATAAAATRPVSPPPNNSRSIERATVLLKARAADACPIQCGYCDETMNHDTIVHANGTNSGEAHSCAVSANGCLDHLCAPGGGDNGLGELQALLAAFDVASIRELSNQFPKLAVNSERQAIQMLGCDSQVVLSMNLTEAQAAELRATVK